MAGARGAAPSALASSALSLDATWRFRPDLEGLRAVAVLLVVGYHAGLAWLPGGYIGVDVFFVLSGFFITGLLVKEIAQSGRVAFARFYARRARRLLPIATLVTVVTAMASFIAYPPLRQPQIGWDAVSAALDVANFRFAGVATDYLSLGQAPSPFLHFWSLAVEEQFYAFWPGIVALCGVALLLRRRSLRRSLILVFAGLAVASLAVSLWLTAVSQPWAFFMLPTRAWQLAVGGLLALFPLELESLPGRLKDAFVVAGLVLVGLAASLLNESSAFPGWLALIPVAGTGLIIAGSGSPSTGLAALLASRPMRALGRWSYSIYLWHWPLFILPVAVLGHQLDMAARLGLALCAVGLGALSFRFAERPIRQHPWLLNSNRRSLTLAGLLVLIGAVAGLTLLLPRLVPPAPAPTNTGSGEPQSSANVLPVVSPPRPSSPRVLGDALDSQHLPRNLTPSLDQVSTDLPETYSDGCHLDFPATVFGSCSYGDPSGHRTVMLVGDSHAAQWQPALDQYGRKHAWSLVALTKSSCPATTAAVRHTINTGRDFTECSAAHREILNRVAREKPDLVVLSSMVWRGDDWQGVRRGEWLTGVTDLVALLKTAGARSVLWLGDVPKPGVNVPECLSANPDAIAPCVTGMSEAIDKSTEVGIEKAVRAGGGAYEPTYSWLCVDAGCPVVVGNLLIYRDDSHLTPEASRWLSEKLGEKTKRLFRG